MLVWQVDFSFAGRATLTSLFSFWRLVCFVWVQCNISVHILRTFSLYISLGADKLNLFNNQELLYLVIIFLILVTLMLTQGLHCEEKLETGHSNKSKTLITCFRSSTACDLWSLLPKLLRLKWYWWNWRNEGDVRPWSFHDSHGM